jgi:hypothetical protein
LLRKIYSYIVLYTFFVCFIVQDKVKLLTSSELTEKLLIPLSMIYYESTTGKLAHCQTKVKVISIIYTILSTLGSNGYWNLSYSATIREKITFITQMLKSKQEIWIQQTSDFNALLKDLLLTVSMDVKTRELKQSSMLTRIFSKMNPFSWSASQRLDAIDHRVSVSYHLIKDSWRKCIKCKNLSSLSLSTPDVCISCKSMLIYSKPEFTPVTNFWWK